MFPGAPFPLKALPLTPLPGTFPAQGRGNALCTLKKMLGDASRAAGLGWEGMERQRHKAEA